MSHGEAQKAPDSYFKSAIKYYFQPKSRSFIAVLYFIFFLYFAMFYASNIFLAVRFTFGTVFSLKTASLPPENVVWGAIFLINLIAPFFISILAIIIPYELRKKNWPRTTRVVLAVIAGLFLFNLILLADFSLSAVEKQTPIATYLQSKNITPKP
ncbi:MAG: hypothetical protein HYV68_03010 [Candidatus Taylorbacteria bacterium]|nr:hypothetical protein [Candidatus Taylorbacteria bacterium]